VSGSLHATGGVHATRSVDVASATLKCVRPVRWNSPSLVRVAMLSRSSSGVDTTTHGSPHVTPSADDVIQMSSLPLRSDMNAKWIVPSSARMKSPSSSVAT
jgi:hypothetical protein